MTVKNVFIRLIVVLCVVSVGILIPVSSYILNPKNEVSPSVKKSDDSIPVIYDKPSEYSRYPYYSQTDSRWSDVQYDGDSTIGVSGCGLVSASMVISYIEEDTITPLDLRNQVGDSCITDGVNDMGKFNSYLAAHYDVDTIGPLWTKDDAYKALDDGYILFAGMQGYLDPQGKNYEGHVIVIWSRDETGMYVSDPFNPDFDGFINDIEFRDLDITYFYGIRQKFN